MASETCDFILRTKSHSSKPATVFAAHWLVYALTHSSVMHCSSMRDLINSAS